MSKRKPDPKSPLRNKLRLQVHQYGTQRRGLGRGYTPEEIARFLELNRKNENGRYETTDVVIAQTMRTSLATVQYLRRKCNMIHRMGVPHEKRVDFMLMSEKTLFDMVHSLV